MKKTMFKRATALVCALTICMGLLAGCATSVTPVSITTDQTELSLKPKEEASLGYAIEVKAGDSNMKFEFPAGADMTAAEGSDEKVIETVRGFIPTWASENEDVATVDETGKVTAVAEGETTITVSLAEHDLSASVTVTVALPEVTKIEVTFDLPDDVKEADDGTVELPMGSNFSVKPELFPEDVSGDNAKLTFESTDENVAVVNDEGLVSPNGSGECIIIITAPNGVKIEVPVRVLIVPTDIALNQSEGSLYVGYGHQLSATVEPEEVDIEYIVVWTSSDEAVATVDENGYVKAVAKGTATITATVQDANGKPLMRVLSDEEAGETDLQATEMSASCKMTVTAKPASGGGNGGSAGGGATGGGGAVGGGGSTGGGGGDNGGGGNGGGGGGSDPAPNPPPAPSIDYGAAISAGYSYAAGKGWDANAPVGGSYNAPCVGSSTEDLIQKICQTIDAWTAGVGGDPMGSGIRIYQSGDGVIVQV